MKTKDKEKKTYFQSEYCTLIYEGTPKNYESPARSVVTCSIVRGDS